MQNKIYGVLFNIAKVIGIVVLAFMLILCLTTTADIGLSGGEKTTFYSHEWSFYLYAVLGAILLILLAFAVKKVPSNALFVFCSIVYFIAGIYIILNTSTNIRADPAIVFDNAVKFSRENYASLEVGEYMFRYPHQLGLLTYDMLLIKGISLDIRVVFIANLLWVILINFYTYKLSNLWFFNNRTVNNLTIIISHLFLPQLFYIKFAYGLIPSFAFITMALYQGSMFYKTARIRHIVLTAVFSSIAVALRGNSLIAVIALIIIVLLLIIKKPTIKKSIVALLLIVATFLPQMMLVDYYEKRTGYDITEGEPKALWVAMAMQECKDRANGWWNTYNEVTFKSTGYDIEEAKEVANKFIKKRFNYFLDNPEYTYDFYMEKIKSTWCNPTFQSIWSGPLPIYNQESKTELLNDIYTGGASYQKLFKFLNVLLVCILLFTLLYLILRRGKDNPFILFPVIFLIGGFLFHIIWETKSQYVYIYIFALIPLCGKAIDMIASCFKTLVFKGFKKVKALVKK